MPARKEPVQVFELYDIGTDDVCWQWNGTWGGREREPRPYFQADGKRMIAYRWVYELVNGVALTPDMQVLHSCDNGGHPIGCGNPAHMRIGTTQDNMNDMTARERHGLPKTVVRAIQRLLAEGKTQQEVADLYGFSRENVSAIATRRTYRHLSDNDDLP